MFEYSNLYTPIEVEFLPHENITPGNGLQLSVNLDILTLDFLEATEKFFDEWEKEQTNLGNSEKAKNDPILQNIKFDIRYKAMILGGRPNSVDVGKRVITNWSLQRNGMQVPVTFEELCKLSQPLLVALYDFCTNEVADVKKKKKTQLNATS